MNLNLLNGTVGSTATVPIIIKEIDFWKQYIQLLNAKNNSKLDWKEIEVLSHVLAGDYHKSHFKGPLAKIIREKFRLSAPDLSRLKNKLVSKKYIEDTGVQRGDAIPTKALRKFQKLVKSRQINEFTVVFPFKIEDDQTEREGDLPKVV